MNQFINQAQIDSLPFPECVRKRKGMYISNINQMVTEIVDNSVDEHFAGYCNNIAVVIQEDTIIVQDDGRGIPITPSKKDPSKTQVELAFTELHAGGKFGLKDSGGYAAKTAGMNGVGGSAVQALSSFMKIEINCNNKKYQIDFEKGYVKNKCKEIGVSKPEERGTTVYFTPDKDIWKDSEPLDVKKLRKRLKQIAYLNPGLNIYFLSEKDSIEESFYYKEGLKDYINELTYTKKKLIEPIYLSKTINDIDIHLSLVYTENYNEEFYTFCNNMATVDKGDHLTGFLEGLKDSIIEYSNLYNISLIAKPEDFREGLNAIIAVRVADPNFEGQAKTKLKMLSVKQAVKTISKEAILEFFDKNPSLVKTLFYKFNQAAKAREAARKARESARNNKNMTEGGKSLKLADCSSKNRNERELFIVEGDSAGGSAKQGRDRTTQAILPVFGKIANVEKTREEEVFKNMKIAEINKATKVKIGNECNADDCKYTKIIIMSDADIDGYHIACLYLTYFYRYQRPLIEQGYIYLACPPLYKVVLKDKSTVYLADDLEKKQFEAINGEKIINISRFKGLGEMNGDQLWETTMNPEKRTLIQITIDDAEEAEAYISLCMGEEVGPRRDWIFENAKLAEEDL